MYLPVILLLYIFMKKPEQLCGDHSTVATRTRNVVIKYDVLVVYVFADTHRYALGNLKYFIQKAVRKDDGVHYYFILQQTRNVSMNSTRLPYLPLNAWYIQHENKCFDIGTIGWFLRTHFTPNSRRNIKSYKYFIFLNSSIRGPFFPLYYVTLLTTYETRRYKKLYWYSIFTQKLNQKVKLVGCTISCQSTPHVQSYFMVTDFLGLSLLMRPENGSDVFSCYESLSDVTLYSELAASTRILENGFWIDSLQTKYQGMDFSRKENKNCNRGQNPYFDRGVDGLTLDPYETVFVKYNYKAYRAAADRAAIYQKWRSNVTF
jgi:hypothetical protein